MKATDRLIKARESSRRLEFGILGKLHHDKKFAMQFYSSAQEVWFINEDAQGYYRVLKDCFVNSKDFFTEVSERKLTMAGFVDAITEPTWLPIENALSELRKNYVRHELNKLIIQIGDADMQDPFEVASTIQGRIVEITSEHGMEEVDMKEIMQDFENERLNYEEKRKEGKDIIGYSTGFPKLDSVIEGIRPGHLWVVGGYTSSGKSFFALNVSSALINQGLKVSFYSLEMGKIDIAGRMMGIFSNINSAYLIKAPLTPTEKIEYDKSKQKLLESGMRIHSEKFMLDDVIVSMMGEKLRGSADVYVIDYGQLISTKDQSEYDTMRKMSMSLQSFARKNNVPIILLSQVSNESAKNPENNIIGFKGSGAIGASADIAIELVSGEKDKHEKMRKIAAGEPIFVKACIKKNRHGRIGEIDYLFNGKTGTFEEFA